ncbi:MAG: polymer-forming cytoskeletal protein, partial [Hyphomicrobium sp.]
MVFQRKHDAKTLTVVAADVTTLPSVAGSQSRPGESVIGNDMSIEGQSITVRCKGSLRVNGAIEADLHCVELIVGEQALIKGSI